MRAIICRGYGPPDKVLQLADIDEPDVADGEVLVRVQATSVNPARLAPRPSRPVHRPLSDWLAQAQLQCPGLRRRRPGRGSWQGRHDAPPR